NPRTSASSTSVSSRICRKPMARRCWSCVLEKNWRPCWARTRADGLDPAGTAGRWFRGLDGEAVPVVRRGAANDVLQADQGCTEGATGAGRADQGADRGGAVVRLPHGGRPPGHEQEHGAADLPADGLASAQTGRRRPTADPG